MVDGTTVATFDQNAGQIVEAVLRVRARTPAPHKVVVFKNGVRPPMVKVRTNLA